LRSVVESLESAQIQLADAATSLERYRSRLDVDPRGSGRSIGACRPSTMLAGSFA
jgi:hypothetical protein